MPSFQCLRIVDLCVGSLTLVHIMLNVVGEKKKKHDPGHDLMHCFWTLFHCELLFGLWVVAGEAALITRNDP